jgi:hypothetical protein
MVARDGVEPPTPAFSVLSFTIRVYSRLGMYGRFFLAWKKRFW